MAQKTKSTTKNLVRTTVYSVKMMFKANPLGAAFITISNLVESAIPSFVALFMGIFITKLTQGDWNGFLFYILLTLGLALVQSIMRHISGYFGYLMQYDIQNFALEQLYTKVAKIPLAMREQKENADKLEIAESYGNSLGWMFPSLISAASQVVAFFTAFIVLANVSLPIAVITIIFTIPSMVLTVYRMRRERKYWKGNSVNRRLGWGYKAGLTDQSQAVEMKLYGLIPYFVQQWRYHITRDRVLSTKINRKLLPLETGSTVLDRIMQFGVLIYSAKHVIDGFLDVGFLVSIKNLMDNLGGAATGLTVNISNIGADLLNASDYFDYLDLPEEKDGNVILQNLGHPPKIEFRDVTFTYPMNTEPTIKNVSFVVEPGEDIALVGENGSGKTTLIKLLLGVYQPDSGQVLIENVPLEQLDKATYYKLMGAL
ncbi:MAG: ABC transporter ATP-binding protein/permease, partial [Candidatus Nomurabacteria bacterium]|nr:ABC transporter ATP-binding protein/permease [Candidatus Nomurabacteria bacterium]